MPAICSTFLGTRAATMPAPRGAGIRRTVTDPHLPVTLVGTVCTCAAPRRVLAWQTLYDVGARIDISRLESLSHHTHSSWTAPREVLILPLKEYSVANKTVSSALTSSQFPLNVEPNCSAGEQASKVA